MRSPARNPMLAATMLATATLLGACASLPEPLQRDVVDITPAQAREAGRPGLPVRWGGRIVETRPLGDRTCFELIGSALDRDGRPLDMTDDGSGRFVACKAGFYDPAVFLKNRELTVVGRIDGFEEQLVGVYDYPPPRVAADVVVLWPEAYPVDARYPAARPWPWFGWDWDGGW